MSSQILSAVRTNREKKWGDLKEIENCVDPELIGYNIKTKLKERKQEEKWIDEALNTN